MNVRPTLAAVSFPLALFLVGPGATDWAGATPRLAVVEPDAGMIDAALHPTLATHSVLTRPSETVGRRMRERLLRRLDPAPALQLAQAAAGQKQPPTDQPANDEEKASLSEINKQLTNPVTSFWSLTFQFNNFNLENGHWNHNMQFQPVLPVNLTKDWNLVTRPVIPIYNSVPQPIGPGRFRQTTAFGDLADVEMISPAHSGPWLLALGPTFIFSTAGSQYTGQGKYQIGPAAVAGYLSKNYIAGIFPQAWWSVSGGSGPPVAQLSLQPFASWFFGQGWSVGYSGTILNNLDAPTGQMWTVPIGLALAKVVKAGPLPIRLAVAGQYMAVRPSNFGQEWNLQLVVAPVIPKLFKGTIF